MIKISIIGMGLIGASLGMALRTADPKDSPLGPVEIVGYDKNSQAVKEARGRLAIDREAKSLVEAARDADLVVLATPVQAMEAILGQLASLLPAGAVVTDVASTKAEVGRWAARLLPSGVGFVGGHPMAGKERSGVAAAEPGLFQGAVYCLTPAVNTPPAALDLLDAMVQTIGAKSYYIDPEEHDAYVAGISHLPFLLSSTLIEVTGRSPAWKEMAPLAATGFRDVSRLASGDPEMYRDICMTNRVAMTRWINETIEQLTTLREQLAQQDADGLAAFFQGVKAQREAWLETKPNMRPGEAEFNAPMSETQRPNLFTFRMPGREKK
jgi:prephenate dehydrogenase